MVVSIFLIIFILQVFADKRILLNDPALVQSQILALERRMEDVVIKNSDLAAKYNDVIAKYNDLFTKYTEQSGKYTDLSTKYNDLSTKYNTLLTKGNGLSFLVSTISYCLDQNVIFEKKLFVYIIVELCCVIHCQRSYR